MKKTLKLLEQEFVSSSGLTRQFAEFARTFKSEVTKELKALGCQEIDIRRGHFYMSGFFKHGDQFWYLSIYDVRFFPEKRLLIRTAQGPRDFTGGCNQYIPIETGMFAKFLSQQSKPCE